MAFVVGCHRRNQTRPKKGKRKTHLGGRAGRRSTTHLLRDTNTPGVRTRRHTDKRLLDWMTTQNESIRHTHRPRKRARGGGTGRQMKKEERRTPERTRRRRRRTTTRRPAKNGNKERLGRRSIGPAIPTPAINQSINQSIRVSLTRSLLLERKEIGTNTTRQSQHHTFTTVSD